MRIAATLSLVALVLSGCTAVEEIHSTDGALHVYAFTYPGSDVFVPGAEAGLGWLFRLHNPNPAPIEVRGCTPGAVPVQQGPAIAGLALTSSGFDDQPCSTPFMLDGGASVAYLVQVHGVEGDVRMQFFVDGEATWAASMDVKVQSGDLVAVRSHVRTATVGVWTNGTSFYTNIPALLQDPAFPAGGNVDINASLDGASPLPVYVYENDRTEQPPASRDTCHFTTIAGYNGLLKDQAQGLTSVRLLHPEQAYTRPGAEDHFLYGEALIFLNTIVSIDEVVDATFYAPETQGACYDPQNTLDYYGVPAESPVFGLLG